jgi:hypothetical protein
MDLIDKLEQHPRFLKYFFIFASLYLTAVFILDYYLSKQ